ncbi:hypothetical protein Tco_0011610 [Tanacetum coccineum]
MSCLPDDIMESVISCISAKETWTDLLHSFEGPPYTKENRVMDLKLDYQTFRAKPTKTLSQTYTRYKTLLNELANYGINLSKHEINVGFVNSLPKKWLTFSHGLRNANHTQTLDLADIYGRFVYEDNLILKKDFYKNFDDEVDERTNYKAKYKKMKAKLALLEASPSSSQNPNTFQAKNKEVCRETFDWAMGKRFLIRKKSLRSRILYCMICKREDHRTSDHKMYTASLKRSENYKAQPYQYASSSKQIQRVKAKPFLLIQRLDRFFT